MTYKHTCGLDDDQEQEGSGLCVVVALLAGFLAAVIALGLALVR